MINITYEKKTPVCLPYSMVGQVPLGTAFVGVVGNSAFELFIRTYWGAQSLTTDTNSYGNTTPIMAFRKVNLDITVKELT